MSASEALTESVRVRLSLAEKAELEVAAALEDRSASAIGRRAIRRELERLAESKHSRRGGDAS